MSVRAAPDEQPGAAPPITAPPEAVGPERSLTTAFLQLPTFDALHSRDFRYLWLGQGATAMGMWMDQVARGWLLYDLTSSPLQLGLLRGLQALPLLVLSPVAGTAADRYDRKLQMMVAQVLDAFMYVVVALLIVSGQIQPWHVYVTAFLGGIVGTFQQPARQSMIAESVPAHQLTNAVALSSVFFNVSRSTGPALAGVLIALVGTAGSYATQAGLYILASLTTVVLPAALSFPTGSAAIHARARSFRGSIVEGWAFAWGDRTVRSSLMIMGSASLFIIPFTTMLPVVAKDMLQVGSTGQGLLLTGMGVGAFCSSVLVASLGDQLPRGKLMLAGVILYGLSVVAFSASPWFPLSVGLMVIVGLFHVSSNTLVQTVIQTYTPAELRGRAMGMFQQTHVITLFGSMALGGLATALGAPWAIAGMAGAGALAGVAIFLSVPNVRSIR